MDRARVRATELDIREILWQWHRGLVSYVAIDRETERPGRFYRNLSAAYSDRCRRRRRFERVDRWAVRAGLATMADFHAETSKKSPAQYTGLAAVFDHSPPSQADLDEIWRRYIRGLTRRLASERMILELFSDWSFRPTLWPTRADFIPPKNKNVSS